MRLEDHAAPRRAAPRSRGGAPLVRRAASRSRRSRRRSGTVPASGVSSTFSDRSTVVLPDPDGPSSAVAVPSAAVKSTPRSTWWSPNALSGRGPRSGRRCSYGEPLQSSFEPVLHRARAASRSPRSRAPRRSTARRNCCAQPRPRSGPRGTARCTSTTDASEVSLTSESSVFDSGGTAIRAACGRMIRRMLCA